MSEHPRHPIDSPRPDGPGGYFPQPHVEVVTRSAAERPARQPWHGAHRMRVFLAVFLVVLLPGLAWDFLRPAQYRATAALLTVATPVPGGTAGGSGAQHLAVQGRVLLGQELLEDTLRRAGPQASAGIGGADGLRSMLEVSSLPDTNLVELRATGGEPEQLAAIVSAWIDAYLDLRRRTVEREVGGAQAALREEYEALGATIAAKREALERFRAENDIVTLERDGNDALARLRTLTADLGRASDEAVEAEARLGAIEAAIALGDPVVPQSEQGALAELEKRASELRARLIELRKRFTPLYLENEPNSKVIPAQLEALEAEIAEKEAQGRKVVVAHAQQEIAQARRRVVVLDAELATQKERAARFTSGFAQYEALQNDLAQLQEKQREAESRLVETQAKGLERYPAVEVVEAAHPPAAPFHPRYWRDALWVLLGAAGAALAAVILLEFLTRRPRGEEEPMPVTGVRVFAGGDPRLREGFGSLPALQPGAGAAIPASTTPSLPGALPRELIPAEVGALWHLADPLSRQLMALLLSGLTLEECAALEAGRFDRAAGTVQPPGNAPRTVPLATQVQDLFTACVPLPLWADADIHQTPQELSARIGLLAHDAGLSQPAEVTAEALRHSYIAYLVRQGARLTELPRLVGDMPASALTRYAAYYAPAGPAKALSEVETLYPALKNPKQRDI